ncbi:MAG: hypothetical protein EON92_20110, partial [Burkholderiales bacterium]
MKRCTSPLNLPALFAAGLALTLLTASAPPAIAQTTQEAEIKPVVRKFPKTAERGYLQMLDNMRLVLNDKPGRLSPGARINGPDNQLLFPSRLIDKTVDVKYIRETGGMVKQVWVLNTEEAKEPRGDSWLGAIGNWFADTPTDKNKIPYEE